MFGIKLVDNWTSGWKWISNICMALSLAVIQYWDMIPADMKLMLQGTSTGQIVFWILVIGIAGRHIDQGTGSKPQ